jgi:O-antigen/teichoic acid export membrane protein
VDRPTARRVFAFSSPWQLQKWLTLLKDNIVPTFVAARFGPQAVGYLTLASTTAQRSTQLLPVLDRVAFATYARLQGDDARLRSAVEFTLFLAAAVIMPTSFLLGALAEPLVLLLYGEKWLPSVPAIRWFAVSAIVSSLNWTTMSTFIATGRPWVPLRITVVWTVLLWSLTLLFCGQYGFTGYALAEAASGVLTLWPARELRRQLGVNVFGVTWRVLLATSAAGLAAFALSLLVSFTLVSLVATGALLGILLYGVIAVLEPTRTLMGLAEVRRWAPATFAPVVDSVARLIRTGSPGRSPWP